MRKRKHELSAWMIYEVAKTWPEADGDTAEAIDFCEFYGREMLRYASGRPLVKIQGEENAVPCAPLSEIICSTCSIASRHASADGVA